MASYKTITPQKLINGFQKCLDDGWGYIYGKWKTMWTQKLQDATTDTMAIKYGSKWIGHYVTDCSGLFYYVFKENGSYTPHGSNSMWNKYCVNKGTLTKGKRSDGQPLKPGTAVFKLRNGSDYYHVGLWDGKKVIEAKGTQYGVVTSKITDWHAWGELKYVDYTKPLEETIMIEQTANTYPTLRQGAKGDIVTMMQDILSKNGSSLQVDGIFGIGTATAPKAFQKTNGLEVDGVCGPKTWAALLATTAANGIVQGITAVTKEKTLEEKVAILWAEYEKTH